MSGDRPRAGLEAKDAGSQSPVQGPVTEKAVLAEGPEPAKLSHEEMDRQLKTTKAQPLSEFVTDYVRYENRWWLLDVDAWLRIDDVDLESTLFTYQRRLSRGLFNNEV